MKNPTTCVALTTVVLMHGAAAMAAPLVFEANGVDAAAIQSTVDDFRNALGALNANEPVNAAGGRRQINWDAAPDFISDPNPFPGDFFNFSASPRARGIEFQATGSTTGFQLSSTAASGEPVEFGLDDQFSFFSAERLFSPVGGVTFDVLFFDPASNAAPATTTGLGVVFTDVEIAGSTSMTFFNAAGDEIFSRDVLTGPSASLSFLGVKFDTAEVARVSIVSGNAPFDGGSSFNGVDGVVMDDFIFGEPTPQAAVVPLPAAGWLLLSGVAALVGLRRRR